jgi:hypothetical protein
MKKAFLAGLIVIIMVLAGCTQPTDSEPTYAVWTDVWTYSDFSRAFNSTLSNNRYGKGTISAADFRNLTSSLPDNTKHDWTEDQIYDWLIGQGLYETDANREKSWLITTSHAILIVRTGNYVDIIIKE